MFESVKKDGQILYYFSKISNNLVVYGTRHLKRDDLKDLFPDYQMCFVQQVHGNKVIPAQEKKLIKADAHWTQDKNKALVVQTADCLPVFIISSKRVCAVHAGWRGVENQISLKALECFLSDEKLEISIGPHIAEESFVVDQDVASKLSLSAPQGNRFVSSCGKKWTVSLADLLQTQILSQRKVEKWHLLDINTFQEEIFYSFRRNSEKKVGQYSFVVKI